MLSGKQLIQLISVIALVLILTACGAVGSGPSKPIIERAIAQELRQTQTALSQQLRLKTESPEIAINHLRVTQRKSLTILNLPAYQVTGTYDYSLKFPKRQVTQRANPFDLYLQRQQEGKTWRIAKLIPADNGTTQWVTKRLKTF